MDEMAQRYGMRPNFPRSHVLDGLVHHESYRWQTYGVATVVGTSLVVVDRNRTALRLTKTIFT